MIYFYLIIILTVITTTACDRYVCVYLLFSVYIKWKFTSLHAYIITFLSLVFGKNLIGKDLIILGAIGKDTTESTRVWLDYAESIPFPQFLG